MSVDSILPFIIGFVAMGATPREWPFYRRLCACVVMAFALLFLYWIGKGIHDGN